MADDILEKYLKEKLGEKEKHRIWIMIRQSKDVTELRAKEEYPGALEIRVHTSDEKLPKWFTAGYLIDGNNLSFDFSQKYKKKDLLRHIINPDNIKEKKTKKLLETLEKDFGGIIADGSKDQYFKTEKFKKSKDYMQVKRKSM
jgi:hypothetical protein